MVFHRVEAIRKTVVRSVYVGNVTADADILRSHWREGYTAQQASRWRRERAVRRFVVGRNIVERGVAAKMARLSERAAGRARWASILAQPSRAMKLPRWYEAARR